VTPWGENALQVIDWHIRYFITEPCKKKTLNSSTSNGLILI